MTKNFVTINITQQARKRIKFAALARDMSVKDFMEEVSLKLK